MHVHAAEVEVQTCSARVDRLVHRGRRAAALDAPAAAVVARLHDDVHLVGGRVARSTRPRDRVTICSVF